jgi:putative DNA primase/helicase
MILDKELFLQQLRDAGVADADENATSESEPSLNGHDPSPDGRGSRGANASSKRASESEGEEAFPEESERPCFRVHRQWTEVQGRSYPPGTYYHGIVPPKKKDDGVPTLTNLRICAPLVCSAITHDRDDSAYGTLLEFESKGGREKRWAIPSRLLAGSGEEALGELFEGGLDIVRKYRNLVLEHIAGSKPAKHLSAATTTGWHDDQTFVLPNEVIGNEQEVWFQSDTCYSEYSKSGTLEGWKAEVAVKAVGNPNLLLAISGAFGGVLMHLLAVPGGGAHLFGDSSTGKTTLLNAGQSAWGGARFSRTWRATANGLESVAALHSDTVLALDEIGEANPKELDAAMYAIANGFGKTRASRTGSARPPARWRVFVLSTGETTTDAKLASGGISPKAGQALRFLNVPVQGAHGAFDQLHGHPNGAAFADAIKQAANRHYGHAGPEFVRRLLERRAKGLQLHDEFIDALESFKHRNDQEGRAAKLFALAGLAGELGITFGLLPWEKGSALQAAVTLYARWQNHREVKAGRNTEDTAILEAVRDFINHHGGSRFAPLHPKEDERHPPVVNNQAGYWDTFVDSSPNAIKALKIKTEQARERHAHAARTQAMQLELGPQEQEAARNELREAEQALEAAQDELDVAQTGRRIYLFTSTGLKGATLGYEHHRVTQALNAAGAFTRVDKRQFAVNRRTPDQQLTRLFHINPAKLG